MKKALLAIVVVLVAIMLIMMVTDTPYEDVNLSGETSSTNDESTSSSHTVEDAESLLGISLPESSSIDILLDGEAAAGVLGFTTLSLDETQAHFEREMANAAYGDSRGWGVSPADSETLQSATFTGNGETWAIILTDEGEETTFDIQRQY